LYKTNVNAKDPQKINTQKIHELKKTTVDKGTLEKPIKTVGDLELMSTGT